MAVKGDLQDMYLENIIHIVCIEKRTAVLKLDREGEKALVYFDNGEIVHALSSRYMVGVEAFYSFLGWSSGTFTLQLGVPAPRKSIKMPCAKLLLTAMETLDTNPDNDAKKIKKSFSPQEIIRDTSLENDLIILISTLEHTQSRFIEQHKGLKPEQLIDLLAGMVNEVAAVVEKYKDMIVESDPLGNFLTLIGYNCPAARYIKVKGNRIATDSSMELYKALKKDHSAQQQFFMEIQESLLYVMVSNYEHLLTCFFDQDYRQQWSDAGKDIFSGLRQMLNLDID